MKLFSTVGVTLALICAAPAYAQTPKLKQTPFSDGTGSIGLAPGWTIQDNYQGAVSCSGPNDASIVLKLPWTIMTPNSSLTSLPASAQQPMAPAGDVVAGLRTVLAKKFGAKLKKVRGKRLGDVSPGTPAYLLMYEYVLNGKSMTCIGYFAPLSYEGDTPFWQLYSSAVIAPTPQFAKMAPAMLAMWRSWKPNGQPPLEGSASATFNKIIAARKASYERIQEEFREQL